MKQADDIKKLYKYRDALVLRVVQNEAYAPLFMRIEHEIELAESFLKAANANDPLARARAIANAYKATA